MKRNNEALEKVLKDFSKKSWDDRIDTNLVDEENQIDAIEGDCWRKYARKLKSWVHPDIVD